MVALTAADGVAETTGAPGPEGAGAAAPPGAVPASGIGAVGVLEHPSSNAARLAATPADNVSRFFALKTKTTLRIS
jgi:hypothetical protein